MDISMCLNKECPLRKSCKRYTATPSEHSQSYMAFEFLDLKNGNIYCENFMENMRAANDSLRT